MLDKKTCTKCCWEYGFVDAYWHSSWWFYKRVICRHLGIHVFTDAMPPSDCRFFFQHAVIAGMTDSAD